MKPFLQICTEYIEGRINPLQFERLLDEDPDWLEWLQSLVPEGKTMYVRNPEINTSVLCPFQISVRLKQYEGIAYGGPKGTPDYHYFVHKEIADLVSEAYPHVSFTRDESLKEDYELCFDACPEYIGGIEVAENNIIGRILAEVPRDIGKGKRKKEVKRRILEAFHITDKKYPRWIQSPEWPVYNGSPMKYVRTEKANSEARIHYFIDPETGTERSVFDAF